MPYYSVRLHLTAQDEYWSGLFVRFPNREEIKAAMYLEVAALNTASSDHRHRLARYGEMAEMLNLWDEGSTDTQFKFAGVLIGSIRVLENTVYERAAG